MQTIKLAEKDRCNLDKYSIYRKTWIAACTKNVQGEGLWYTSLIDWELKQKVIRLEKQDKEQKRKKTVYPNHEDQRSDVLDITVTRCNKCAMYKNVYEDTQRTRMFMKIGKFLVMTNTEDIEEAILSL